MGKRIVMCSLCAMVPANQPTGNCHVCDGEARWMGPPEYGYGAPVVDVEGEPDEPMVGNIRAQLITDPDAHQTSFQHFSLTGENWIGTTCYPDGADIQGGGL